MNTLMRLGHEAGPAADWWRLPHSTDLSLILAPGMSPVGTVSCVYFVLCVLCVCVCSVYLCVYLVVKLVLYQSEVEENLLRGEGW